MQEKNYAYKVFAGFSKSQALAIQALDSRKKTFEELVGVDDSSNKRLGSVVVTHPTSHREVLGLNPGLVVLFSLTELVPKHYRDYQHIFSKEKSNRLPEHKSWDLEINIKEGQTLPKPRKAFAMLPKESKALREFIEQELQLGRIRPSQSETEAPVFFIKKKDGGLRFVQDYRGLNTVTIRNRYPIPLTSELVDQLREAKYFTHLDLRNGYNNIRVKEGHEHKLAFQTPLGLFELLVMYFGMTNAPGAFQSLMNEIFRDMISNRKIVVYLDDILIYSKTLEQHREIVREVLRRLKQHNLYLKPEKCKFEKLQTEFLGLIVSKGKIAMDPIKMAGVADWPTPRKLKESQGFMGFANFY